MWDGVYGQEGMGLCIASNTRYLQVSRWGDCVKKCVGIDSRFYLLIYYVLLDIRHMSLR